MFSGTQGSNSWVIPGKNSTTGMPLLCNDMHLPISSPSLWYFNHLFCPIGSVNGRDYHTAGVSLPGFPYVLVGHNEKIAWGATVSFVDNEDLFVEKINQSDKTYLFMDDWRPLKSVREEIAVRGEQEYIEEVLLTHHGPIISNLIPSDDTSLSLQSAALLISEGIEGFGLLGEAHNWTEFTEAICAIRVPPLNLMYADVEGNIGYYVSGTVPIRAKGKGLVPVPGWNGEYEWNGSIPFSEMPHAFNPDIDYLVNANNKIVGADYPHYLGSSWRNGFRARRIKQLLEANGKRTKENCCAMQNDVVSSLGIEFVDFLTDFEIDDPKANISLELIRTWDGSMDNQATGAAVYKVLLEMLARRILRPKLGEALLAEYLGEGFEPTLYSTNELQGHWPVVALRLLDNPQSKWWDNEEHLVRTLTKSLADTTRYLEHKLGNNPAYWYWSRIHEIKFDHTLANNPLLDAIFSLGPFPIGGDQDTIAQSSILNEVPGDNIAASYRQIIDLSDLSRSIAMHAPGQSGHLGSSNYSDLVHPWLNGSYYEMSWDIADSISTPEHLLEMLPE
jgi:penicillin amidase